jgi:uncharacterized membrane protein YfcA
MEILLGVVIGLVIAATGLGAGILTTPLLILLFGLPAAECVGTALLFSTVVKVLATFLYARRGHVDRRVLGYLLAGGIPGAIAGALLLDRMRSPRLTAVVLALVGSTVILSALLTMIRSTERQGQQERPGLLSWLALPVGLQVGFSSSGAGALGTILLFRLTRLAPVAVVGTDLAFGLAVSIVGGALHLAAGNYLPLPLAKLLVGGLAGVPLGAAVANRMPAARLRTGVLLCATLLGVWLAERGLAQWIGGSVR